MKIVRERIIPEPGRSFATLDKRAPAFDGRFHFHPENEITLIESSMGRRVVGDSIESFEPGDLVLLGENLPHQYVSDSSRQIPAQAKVIQFRTDFMGEALLKLPEFSRVAAMLTRAARGLKFSSDITQDAAQLIGQLFRASHAQRLLLLLQLLDVLSRDSRSVPIASAGYVANLSTREGDAIDRALEYMNDNFREPLTLHSLCRHLHVSPATCNRLLQKSLGRSFKSFLNEVRISHACRLLLETDKSVLDVAYTSGFTNLSNFNRRFKELKHYTPREYRNLMARELAPVAAH